MPKNKKTGSSKQPKAKSKIDAATRQYLAEIGRRGGKVGGKVVSEKRLRHLRSIAKMGAEKRWERGVKSS